MWFSRSTKGPSQIPPSMLEWGGDDLGLKVQGYGDTDPREEDNTVSNTQTSLQVWC